MTTDVNPQEIISVAAKIIDLVSEHVACSSDVLIGALKVASTTFDEARNAQMSAQLRADMIRKLAGK